MILGLNHRYIKPIAPKHNSKIERSYKTDKIEFNQSITYLNDIDFNNKLVEWETFYNFDRPHSVMNGKTPYERILDKIG